MQHETPPPWLIRSIMAAVFVWGTFLAIGAGIFGIHAEQGGVTVAPNLLRGFIVWLCVIGFLALWAVALRRHSAK